MSIFSVEMKIPLPSYQYTINITLNTHCTWLMQEFLLCIGTICNNPSKLSPLEVNNYGHLNHASLTLETAFYPWKSGSACYYSWMWASMVQFTLIPSENNSWLFKSGDQEYRQIWPVIYEVLWKTTTKCLKKSPKSKISRVNAGKDLNTRWPSKSQVTIKILNV